MEMDLVGIKNQNEYYTSHYFTSIFKENAEDTIKEWKSREKEEDIQLPWKKMRDISRQYYRIRDRYQISKGENQSKFQIQELAELYLKALGFENIKSVNEEVADGITVPIYHEETKPNGAPLFWAFLSVAEERGDDILQGKIFGKTEDEDLVGKSVDSTNDEILSKLFFAGEEAPRFIMLIGINQIALIDRNKWNEKRYLQFMMDDIYSRHEESTFMAMTVLLHKESLCPNDGACVLDSLDENSHKHSAGVSDALKYALRECIEILGNEVIYDMKTRQGIDLVQNPVNASELTLECLRYMYRFLFMLFIEARPELGYAPMKSQIYVQGYSLEGLRDVCDRVKDESEAVAEGYYIDDTLKELFRMTYYGYPEVLDEYKRAIEIEKESMHDVFTIEALKAHIFDPEYTKLITEARLRNSAMLKIVDHMSISRPSGRNERRGRISYSALGINQMGAVYEALLSYRGFIAEETLFEVKRKGEKFNELDVGYFIPERELDNYEEDERVRYEKGELKGQLRKYEQGTFIYRLAGREREKSASYYTPEVLTKCLVKYALKELLKDKSADEILNLTICEPAMGSAAFLNESINQLAEAYLNKKQEELGKTIPYDQRFEELQKVKMFIADRNVYGVDLNPIAVELAEVSLWLNTIYKGAYVPWFGTQLVCGNSLIGARRQVYLQSQLEAGKWWDKAPTRIKPGEERTRKGQHEHTKGIYHFLLGDAGMANYTDKVIKGLEPDNIKKINEWRKEFTSKYDENDIQTLLSLSESIDDLWRRTVELRKKVVKATFEPLSVFGHDESDAGSHTTIREKDAIYNQLFKSEHMNNAGPYARLKAAMDYWCALWFWPIDKADLLPDRQTFFFEMSLLLEGTINAVSTSASGQMSFIDSSGNASYDEEGNLNYLVDGSQIALEFQSQYATLGRVNLDELRENHERLAIANQIAEEQKFLHWELEFADVFEDNGGFDLIVGNPPWLKLEWTELDVLAEMNPMVQIKKMSAAEVTNKRDEILTENQNKGEYINAYRSVATQQKFYSSVQNYKSLASVMSNLYKMFLPQAVFQCEESKGVFAFIHQENIFDDAKGGELRKLLLPRLKYHFQFINEKKLFSEIDHHTLFSLNVYSNRISNEFDMITNLFIPETIEGCYADDGTSQIPGIKNGKDWDTRGHKDRIIHVGKDELMLFAQLFDGNSTFKEARIPSIHTTEFVKILKILNNCNDDKNEYFTTNMWTETSAIKDGLIKKMSFQPKKSDEVILSGSNIFINNAFYKVAREVVRNNSDFDSVYLKNIDKGYLPRTNFMILSDESVKASIPDTPWETKYTEHYRLFTRKMIDSRGERTLISCIVPPGFMHTDAIRGVVFKNERELCLNCAVWTSLIADFFIKTLGKENVNVDTIEMLGIGINKYIDEIILRILLLNCLNENYSDLWEKMWSSSFNNDKWGKNDSKLNNKIFRTLTREWKGNKEFASEFCRRELQIELDVLIAMNVGLDLEDLLLMYRIQFPVMSNYENDTWYDSCGDIIFSSKNYGHLTISRKEWNIVREGNADVQNGAYTYHRPYINYDRKKDYEEVWRTFEKRFSNN